MTFVPEPRELYAVVELQPASGPATRTEHMVIGWSDTINGQTVPVFFQRSHHGGAVSTLSDLYATSSYEVRVVDYRIGSPPATEVVPTEDQQRVMHDIVDRIRRGGGPDCLIGADVRTPNPQSFDYRAGYQQGRDEQREIDRKALARRGL